MYLMIIESVWQSALIYTRSCAAQIQAHACEPSDHRLSIGGCRRRYKVLPNPESRSVHTVCTLKPTYLLFKNQSEVVNQDTVKGVKENQVAALTTADGERD
jgi:hypothetical protein